MAVVITIKVESVENVTASSSNPRRSFEKDTEVQPKVRTHKVRVECDDLRTAVEKAGAILQIIKGQDPWEVGKHDNSDQAKVSGVQSNT